MRAGFTFRSLRLAGLLALFASMLLAGEGQSRQQSGKPATKPAKEKANPQVKLKESEALKEAYILLEMANHNYAGHREKAIKQVEEGIKLLDKSILKNGANGQKVVALKEEIEAARAKFIAKHEAQNHEPQALSDLQMREALKLLVNVHTALAQRHQPKVREHVDNAVKQVEAALKTR